MSTTTVLFTKFGTITLSVASQKAHGLNVDRQIIIKTVILEQFMIKANSFTTICYEPNKIYEPVDLIHLQVR